MVLQETSLYVANSIELQQSGKIHADESAQESVDTLDLNNERAKLKLLF